MPKYIDADAFRKMLIDRQITTQFFNPKEREEIGCIIEMLDETPAADVVPRAEIVREIFEKIDKITLRYLDEKDYTCGEMTYDLDKLKWKYTEEQ